MGESRSGTERTSYVRQGISLAREDRRTSTTPNASFVPAEDRVLQSRVVAVHVSYTAAFTACRVADDNHLYLEALILDLYGLSYGSAPCCFFRRGQGWTSQGPRPFRRDATCLAFTETAMCQFRSSLFNMRRNLTRPAPLESWYSQLSNGAGLVKIRRILRKLAPKGVGTLRP